MTTQNLEKKNSAFKKIDIEVAEEIIQRYNEKIVELTEKLLLVNPEDTSTIISINSELKGILLAKELISYRSGKIKELKFTEHTDTNFLQPK